MRRTLTGARLFTGGALLDDHALVLDGDHIADIVPARDAPNLPAGSILAPGFIDTQANGGGGALLNATPDAATVRTMQAAHRLFGTTTLLPTLITDTAGKMRAAVDAACEAGAPGIHLEGPFLSIERRGVHEARFVRKPEPADIDYLCSLPARLPRVLVSLAPEMVALEDIARLARAGVVVAGAHSTATYERTREALAHGMTGFTHLFNAMPPLSNRAPSIAGAALDDPASFCGLIVDGVHVHPAMMRLALAAKPRGKLFLVTDAMSPLGTDVTSFELYGQTIHRRDGRLVTDDGTLAGADLDMAAAVRNTVSMLGVSLEEALRMASLYPAQFLGLADRGRLAPGLRADLVLLDEDLHVRGTWVGGESQGP